MYGMMIIIYIDVHAFICQTSPEEESGREINSANEFKTHTLDDLFIT